MKRRALISGSIILMLSLFNGKLLVAYQRFHDEHLLTLASGKREKGSIQLGLLDTCRLGNVGVGKGDIDITVELQQHQRLEVGDLQLLVRPRRLSYRRKRRDIIILMKSEYNLCIAL